MSIDKDPEVYKILVGVVMALIGVLNMARIRSMNSIKKNIEELFAIAHENKNGIVEIKTRCDEREKHENRKN